MLEHYLQKILTVARRGDAREESYYPILVELLEGLNNKRKVQVTSQPKKTEGVILTFEYGMKSEGL